MSGISQFDNIKSSVVTEDTLHRTGSSYVTFCQVCGWYGYPYEKIVVEFEGIRSEEEDGFVDKFTEYDYDAKTVEIKRIIHRHKYDPKLVQEAVDFALRMRNGDGNQKND
jgi:hypothetical protein